MKVYGLKLKIVKTFFVVFSLLLLTQNWVVVNENYKDRWERYFDTFEDATEWTNGTASWLLNYVGVDAEYVVHNMIDIQNILKYMGDGEFTQVEINEMLLEGKALIPIMRTMFNYSGEYNDSFQMFVWIYEVVYWMSIIFGCLQLLSICFRGKICFDKLFVTSQSILLLLTFFICWIPYYSMEIWLFRPTVWSVLAVVCALNIFPNRLVEVIESIKYRTKNSFKIAPKREIVTWVCKGCGTKNNEESRFCNVCGKKKSEIIICNKCGAKMWDDEEFCKFCKQAEKTQNAKNLKTIENIEDIEDIEDIEGALKDICPHCGCKIEQDSLFCQYCGQRI